MQFFRNPRINFVGMRRRIMPISLALILVGLVSVGLHKGFNTSIDFAGGTLVEVQFGEPVALDEVRDVVEGAGLTGAEITNFGSDREILIKIKQIGEAAETARQIESVLQEQMANRTIDIRRVESVGPKIGSELKTASFWAIIYSLVGIVVYITWRFEFRFAIAAIIALIHDVLFTLGFFSVANREISIPVIAGLLTIVGYSLNDTIVVFDRIRENLHSRKREGYSVVVNSSINETLSRTVITSLTTLVVVACLVIIGGPVIRDFALTLLVGVLIGTYSSIFIASSVLVEWENWRSKQRKRKK
ncbi:MAG: protein translocase subunit SecF [Candidatus Latescibacterota bacterium]|nr:MAG: protein translocase subunit SecF [Candidatus Latescibacterota bacterium]